MDETEPTDANAQQEPKKSFVSQNPADVVWVNASKTGKGATIAVNGDLYVAPLQSLQKLANGETRGAKFVKIIR